MALWYLIHTKPACEALAQAHLARQGYSIYYPRLLRPALVRGRWVERIGPLFPRYLFLHLDAGHQAMGPVRSTIGVANIVRFGGDYAVVADQVIESLRTRADPETGLHRLCRQSAIEPGSQIRIVAGAFDGLEGVFQREAGDDRVVVLLDFLGLNTPVRVPAAFVLPQPGSHSTSIGARRAHHAHR